MKNTFRVAILIVAETVLSAEIGRASERFTNGDFEAGVTGFTSDYAYNGLSNTLDGQFAVVSNPNGVHPSWAIYGDHTTGTGLMQTANGSAASGLAIWRETVDVVPGADYTFSAWGASSFTANAALLSFRANDVQFLTLQLPDETGGWRQATTVINAGASSSIEFEIVDLTTFGFGNDFTLDDISLDGPVPVPEPSLLGGLGLAMAMLGVHRLVRRTNR